MIQRTKRAKRDKAKQGELPLRKRGSDPRGGKREGAGRPKSKSAGVSHSRRPNLASRYPVHVTLKTRRDLGNLRTKQTYRVIRGAFEAVRGKQAFRVCHYSIQRDHIHMVVEAKDRQALSRGVQGLSIRVARGLNGCLHRRGKVFADRYHAHILKTPKEVKHTLNYVLNNRLRHRPIREGNWYLMDEDGFSSAAWFVGWRSRGTTQCVAQGPPPVSEPQTWLLSTGWRRHGLLVPAYVPPKSKWA